MNTLEEYLQFSGGTVMIRPLWQRNGLSIAVKHLVMWDDCRQEYVSACGLAKEPMFIVILDSYLNPELRWCQSCLRLLGRVS